MTPYSALAWHYDALMAHLDYAGFADRLVPLLGGAEIVLDLGCGTGTLAALLAGKGYDVIGVDASADMLSVAQAKTDQALFLQQRMPELDLYGTVQAAVCTLDGLNYLTHEDDLRQTLSRVCLFLEPGGRFIFDIHAPGILAARSGAARISRSAGAFCAWEYSWKAPVCRMDITLFAREGAIWRRHVERHEEREYLPERMSELLRKAGFSDVSADVSELNCFDETPTDRIFFVCTK